MINFVTYYATPPSSVSRNSGVAVVYGSWPARVLKHRGWTKKREICRRVSTDEEDQWLATCMRHEAFLYPTLDGLLADESQFRSKESLDIFRSNVNRYFPACTNADDRC